MAVDWIGGYPFVASKTATSVNVSGSLSESGSVYMVVLPTASGAPTSQNIYNGESSSGVSAPAAHVATGVIPSSGTAVLLSASGLTEKTDYKAWLTVSGDVTDELYATGVYLGFSTPSMWLTGYPAMGTVFGTSGIITMSADELCSGFVVALPATSGIPSATQIYGGLNASGNPVPIGNSYSGVMGSSGVILSGVLSGLVENIDYIAYCVTKDDYGNLQPSGTGVSFSTDVTRPLWTTGYPNITGLTVSAGYVNMSINDTGSGYFVVIPQVCSAPSYTQIIAGTDAGGVAIATGLKGNSALVSGTAVSTQITGLTYSVRYTAYATAIDDGGNVSNPAVVSGNFRAAVPPPGVVTGISQRERRRRRDKRIRRAAFGIR